MERKTQSGQALIELVFGLTLVAAFFLAAFALTDTAERQEHRYRFQNQQRYRR
jgi:type II secretory pathway component PulJ